MPTISVLTGRCVEEAQQWFKKGADRRLPVAVWFNAKLADNAVSVLRVLLQDLSGGMLWKF